MERSYDFLNPIHPSVLALMLYDFFETSVNSVHNASCRSPHPVLRISHSGSLPHVKTPRTPLPPPLHKKNKKSWPSWYHDSPQKHTGFVPVHPWKKAWFMARDPGLRGEIGLCHCPDLILILAVPHNWAPLGPRQVFFIIRLFYRRHPSK